MSRTNIDVNRTIPGVRHSELYYNNGVPSALLGYKESITDTAVNQEIVKIKRTSVVTSGFNSPLRTGRLKPLAFAFVYEHTIGELGYDSRVDYARKKTDYNYNTSYVSGCNGPATISARLASLGEISNLNAVTTAKVLSKIKNQKVNTAQMFSERKQVVNMIEHTLVRFIKSVRALHKGDFLGAAGALGVLPRKRAHARFKRNFRQQQLDATAKGWLELQYGWKPFLNDIYGACEQIAKQHSAIQYFTATSRTKRTISLNTQSKTGSSSYYTYLRSDGELKIEVAYSVTYENTNPAASLPSQLGITNPILIAWELMPFSFVVDWFLPVGNFIGNFDATAGLSFYSGYRTEYQSTSVVGTRILFGKSGGQNIDMIWKCSQSKVNVIRETLAGFPTNTFPRFKNPISIMHAANALALLSTLLKKK